MRPIFRFLLPLLLGLAAAHAGDGRDDARQARSMLGPAIWSRVVRIENSNRQSRYPDLTHALVFQLAGILWFYDDVDGTQSLSLHRGRLAEEKADFRPLLRAIDPGFTRWTILPDSPLRPDHWKDRLPNGCFIESVTLLRRLLAERAEVARPRLLSYYLDDHGAVIGHTVLTYETVRGLWVVDPSRPTHPLHFRPGRSLNALRLADSLRSGIFAAHYVPVDDLAA